MNKGLTVVKAIVPATLTIGALVVLQLGANNEGLRQALRATARLSLIPFALAYLAAPYTNYGRAGSAVGL